MSSWRKLIGVLFLGWLRMDNIDVSLCITSFNRLSLLEECVRSFFKTNLYDLDKLELIIVDNGSTNEEVVDYIKNLKPPCKKYSYILNQKNDFPTCLKYAKVQARRSSVGNYFIDCPDDHLFLVKRDWIAESIQHINNATDVGCVIHFAYPFYRFQKANNKMRPHPLSEDFYESIYKGYADYHIMSKKVYQHVGEINYNLEKNSLGDAEREYMQRSLEHGYKRNLMSHPVAIINDNGSANSSLTIEGYELVDPITEQEYEFMLKEYPGASFPVCNEMLFDMAVKNNKIRKIEGFQKIY